MAEVSIPRLLRVHFANIGHNDARLSPLTLDFQRETEMGRREPLDSIIWAENGVGKSSIRTLLFSLLHPNINDVMRATNGPMDNRKYENYFNPRDVSFVLTEWALPPSQQPSLAGMDEVTETVIIGFVASWPTGVRTSLSDLDRHYFMFRPSGVLTFERMPVRGLAEGVDPVRSSREFLEWFRENCKSADGRSTTVHREWLEWLMEVGLDPKIFTYQLRMNGGQGGILGLFKNRINSSTDFVHFFLETVLNADIASDVIEVLNEKRRHIEKKPQWQAEVQFVDEALPLLEMLQKDKAALEEAEERQAADKLKAGGLIAGLALSEAKLKGMIDNAEGRVEDLEVEIVGHKHAFTGIQEYRNWLRREECNLRLEAAQEQLKAAREGHHAARKRLQLLRAAAEYNEWQLRLNECKAIESELNKRRHSYEDVETELRNAGTALVQVLDREIKRADREYEDAKKALTDARRQLTQMQKDHNAVKSDLGKVRESIRGTNAQIQKREKALHRLLASGALQEAEAPADALERWEALLEQADMDGVDAEEARSGLEEERKQLDARRTERLVALTKAQSEMDRLRHQVDRDELRRQSLATDEDLRALLDHVEEVDLSDEDLANTVAERIAKLQRESFRLQRLLEDDKETLESIEASSSQLYPPPREVVSLLNTLREDFGIPAHFAAEELDNAYPEDPDTAEAQFVANPARYMGIMVHTAEALEQVKRFQDAIPKPAFPVVISVAGSDAAESHENALVLKPGHQAAFNRMAARDLIEPLVEKIRSKEDEIVALGRRVKRCQRAADGLDKFLVDYPDGTLRALMERVDAQAVRLQGLEGEQQRDQERLVELERELAKLDDRLKAALNLKRDAQSALARLRDFMEDYEHHYQELQETLASLRARLHELEDEGLRLEASIEEQQHLATHRQEMVFNRKSEFERLSDQQQGVRYQGGELADITHVTVTEAEQSYDLCMQRFRKVSEKDETLRARLEEKQNVARAQEKRFRGELLENSVEAVEEVVVEGAIQDRLVTAQAEEDEARGLVGSAQEAVKQAKAEMSQLAPVSDDFKLPKGEKMPQSVEAARRKRAKLQAELESLQEQIDVCKAAQDELRDKLRNWERHASLRKFKREELERHLTEEIAKAEPEELPEDNAALERYMELFWSEFNQHRREYSNCRLGLDRRCEKLEKLAADPRFAEFSNDKREILKVRESLLRLTEDIIKEFEVFRKVIETSLKISEEATDAIVTRLDASVSDAVHLITLSKSASRLPDAMEGWGGRSFLKITPRGSVGATLDERRPTYEKVLREVLKSGKPLRGLDLVKRCVDALVGEKGFSVTVMKPGYALKTNLHDITEVKSWSDGEKITSVILLYCTMVQLRAASGAAQSTADKGMRSNGMLFLDNPFGEANSMTFVRMQLTMARALNIQLVYTASGSHKHLMARFPRVVRLSQESGLQSNKTYVKATDVGQELRAQVNVTSVRAAHFGRRAPRSQESQQEAIPELSDS